MYDIDTLKRLRLGKVGENEYHSIEIDCRKWLEEIPDAILTIFTQRNG